MTDLKDRPYRNKAQFLRCTQFLTCVLTGGDAVCPGSTALGPCFFVHRVSRSVCHFCLCTCRHLVFFILVASHSVPCQCVIVITLSINFHVSTLFELCTTLVLFTPCMSTLPVHRAMSAFADSSSAASSSAVFDPEVVPPLSLFGATIAAPPTPEVQAEQSDVEAPHLVPVPFSIVPSGDDEVPMPDLAGDQEYTLVHVGGLPDPMAVNGILNLELSANRSLQRSTQP